MSTQPYRRCNRASAESGFSILELLTVTSLGVILSGVAVLDLRKFDDPLQNSAAQISSLMKQARAQAISSTSAYTVHPTSANHLVSERGTSCSDASPVNDPHLALELPSGAALSDTTWTVCFNSRGMPDGNIDIPLQDVGGESRTVEVLLGGAVRIR